MAARRAVPRYGDLDSANERLKSGFRPVFWSSIILATVLHFGAFALWPELTAEDFPLTSVELTAIELPPVIEIPPPPARLSRPATPVMATTTIDEEITIAPTTFEMNPVEVLPPPPAATAREDLAEQPTFTPFTVAPRILNKDEIVRAMARAYPPTLREAGIGGQVYIFFFIDEEGRVQTTRIDQSSGHEGLDEAALAVADLYRFSPALNRDQRVPVWVSFPIRFEIAPR